jgi:hypothetical protein
MFGPGSTGPISMPSNDSGDQQVGTDPPSGSVAPTSTSSQPVGTFDPSSLPSGNFTLDSKNWAADGQLNILLVGVDNGKGGSRNQGLRPDTMMVLHTEIKTGRSALIGIPRNLMCVPLPQAIAAHYSKAANGCPAYTYPYMLNWLANDAGWNHPSWFSFDQG